MSPGGILVALLSGMFRKAIMDSLVIDDDYDDAAATAADDEMVTMPMMMMMMMTADRCLPSRLFRSHLIGQIHFG